VLVLVVLVGLFVDFIVYFKYLHYFLFGTSRLKELDYSADFGRPPAPLQ